MHVDNLKAQNTQLQERCSESESQIDELEQYGRSLCLRITGISTEEKETSNSALTKVKELIDESGVNIPDSTIDCAHRTGKKKAKSQMVVIPLTTHRHRTLFYKARKKIKSGPKIHIDFTKKQFNLLKEAQILFQIRKMMYFFYADINCRLIKFISEIIL